MSLGHHIDTRYAFNDRLLFPDESTFQRINMNHTDHDNACGGQAGNDVSAGLDVQGPAAQRRSVLGRSLRIAARS